MNLENIENNSKIADSMSQDKPLHTALRSLKQSRKESSSLKKKEERNNSSSNGAFIRNLMKVM